MLFDKRSQAFFILAGIFIANALLAEFIGVKVFSFEKSIGLPNISWSLWGYEDLSWQLSAGVLLWPVVFVLTDIINEYYGMRSVRFLSYFTVGLIIYSFIMIKMAIELEPADFWPQSHILPEWTDIQKNETLSRVGDYDHAFRLVFGQGLWIIIGSICAFLIGQFLDVIVFHRIKYFTGEKAIWLRATGSTLFSQFIDSFIVLFIAFYLGAGWDIRLVLAIGLVNYSYKFIMAIVMTPIIYLAHYRIDRYLGHELATQMKNKAHEYR